MKKCSVGGQAVLEGVMMRTPEGGVALAVRKSDRTIITEYTQRQSKAKKGSFLGLPVVRGVVAFVDSVATGMQITMRSAELFGEGFDEEPSKLELWLSRKLGKSVMDVTIGVAIVLAALLAVALFVFLPSLASQLIPWNEQTPTILKSLTEGLARLIVFLCYISAISLMKDIRRLYMYHGAEHKTIDCYEHELPLTTDNVMRCSRMHPRCGTNYLFLVIAVSILFFSLLPYSDNLLMRVATRLLFLPLVAGLAYEVMKLAAASDGLIARIVRAPGMGIQRLTTREPDPDMIEVAITAFELAMNATAVKDGEPVAEEQTATAAQNEPTDSAGETAETAGKTELEETAEEPRPA